MEKITVSKRMSFGKWVLLISVCLLSAAFLRARNVRSEEPEQEQDRDGLDYVCIQDVAVEFNQDATWKMPLEEMKVQVPSAEAKRRCRPPLVPWVEGSKLLGSGMDFDTGYGGMLSQYAGTKEAAVSATESVLESVGWLETPASIRLRSIKKDTTVRMFERKGAWLMAIAVDGKPHASTTEKNSVLFVVGQWRRDLLERL